MSKIITYTAVPIENYSKKTSKIEEGMHKIDIKHNESQIKNKIIHSQLKSIKSKYEYFQLQLHYNAALLVYDDPTTCKTHILDIDYTCECLFNRYRIWKSKKTNHILIAFQGTQTVSNIAANVAIAFGVEGGHKRFNDSFKIYKRVLKKYPDHHITLCGHSLGGSICEYINDTAISKNIKHPYLIYTFNRAETLFSFQHKVIKYNHIDILSKKFDPVSIFGKLVNKNNGFVLLVSAKKVNHYPNIFAKLGHAHQLDNIVIPKNSYIIKALGNTNKL